MKVRSKKNCMTLNYIEHLLILVSVVTGCDSTSAFASLIGIPIGTTSSAVGIKTCRITEGIKNNNLLKKLLIKKRRSKKVS